MKLNKVIKIVLTLVLFLAVSSGFAQGPADVPDPGGTEDTPGSPLEPGAPIADYILPMLVVGIATAYVMLRKKATAQVS